MNKSSLTNPHGKCSMRKIDLVIESCYDNIDLVGICIESLSSELFDQPQCHNIKVVVYEAVTNCIKHSYQGKSGQAVHVTCQMEADRLLLDIADSGIAMDPQNIQSLSPHFHIDPDNLLEGGMGLKIIKLFMDDMHYQTKDGVNHLTLIKYNKPPPAP